MNDLKDLLDDVAAEATDGLRIDLVAAQDRSTQRRARLRLVGAGVMAAAVATAAAVAVGLAVPQEVERGAAPAVGEAPAVGKAPTGLPDRWYYVPPWTPPATDGEIERSSMLLDPAAGPVLVGDDATRYRAVPWEYTTDGLATLSPDGTRVAWVSQDVQGDDGPVVHTLRTGTGEGLDVDLGEQTTWRATALLWAGDRLYLQTVDPTLMPQDTDGDDRRETWAIETTGPDPAAPVRACRCAPPIGTDSAGRLVQAFGDPMLPNVPTVGYERSVRDGGNPEPYNKPSLSPSSWPMVVSPDGTRSVVATPSRELTREEWLGVVPVEGDVEWQLNIYYSEDGGELLPVRGDEPVTYARALAWTDAGVVVAAQSRDRQGRLAGSIRLVDPDDGSYEIVSRKTTSTAIPVGVAAQVVGDGRAITAGEPDLSPFEPTRIEYEVREAWVRYGQVAVAALALLAGVLLVRRLRRRPTPP